MSLVVWKLAGVQRAHDGEHEREAAGVVADSWRREARALALDLDVSALGKHRVEMSDDGNHRPGARALADAHDVACGVHFDVGQPVLTQHLEIGLWRAPVP